VRDGVFYADDMGDPRDIFAVVPTVVFGFGKEQGFRACFRLLLVVAARAAHGHDPRP
jgi:hypothetical protein